MEQMEKTIYEAMVFINLNLYEHITLDTLSERFSYSKYHLHRKFKDVAGVTLNGYIKRRRIENSLYLLFANIDVDISEIALYCGFSSATYSREFKKLFNRSPKQWRNIYKKGTENGKDSKICKNYERFICYIDNGIPKEIKEIGIVELAQRRLAVRIFYGSYYGAGFRTIWDEMTSYEYNSKSYIGIPINSPSVTDPESCLYLLGFESGIDCPGLSSVDILGGSYIRLVFSGSISKLGEVYTWILKYYLPMKGLKYDYRVQLQEFCGKPDFARNELECNLYIPIAHA